MATGIKIQKRSGESTNSFIYRFTKRIKRAGVLKEAKKRRFHKRKESKIKRRGSALRREGKKKEVERKKKLGLL